MSLNNLNIGTTKVANLTPIRGLPLTTLIMDNTFVVDVSPLQGMKLEVVSLTPPKISNGI